LLLAEAETEGDFAAEVEEVMASSEEAVDPHSLDNLDFLRLMGCLSSVEVVEVILSSDRRTEAVEPRRDRENGEAEISVGDI